MDSQSKTNLLFQELIEVTNGILDLSFDDDMNETVLNQFQLQQSIITSQINVVLTEHGQAVSEIQLKQQVTQCLHLEELVRGKMARYQSEIAVKLKLINNGSKARDGYLGANSYADGYFIDKHN
jgi:hypothetical protein